MAKKDLLPGTDPEFDILQAILVAAVVANAAGWNIPLTEVTKLTDAQTPWTNTWAIAKDKQNCTTAQRKAKDLARSNYKKVMRAFIQKWIYRNDSMDDTAIEECGLKPRDTSHTPATKPGQPVAKAKRAEQGAIIGSCEIQPEAKRYCCIVTEGAPLPDGIAINEQGRFVWSNNKNPNPDPNPPKQNELTGIIIDFTDQRVKKFTGLKHDVTYYIYFFSSNTAGVSILSEPVSIVCW